MRVHRPLPGQRISRGRASTNEALLAAAVLAALAASVPARSPPDSVLGFA